MKELKIGDVFYFEYKPEIREENLYLDHCFDGQLVVHENSNKELVLVDTYWGSSNNHRFTLQEAEEKGTLTFRFNLSDVEDIGNDCEEYYDEKDIFDFSHQHHCYKRWVLRNGAKRSKEVMLKSINKKINDVRLDIDSAVRQIELLTERKVKIEAGDLKQFICDFYEIGSREIAKEIGVSHSTVTRIINGKNTDIQTAVKLLAWLFLP
jgi:hypothetical protein